MRYFYYISILFFSFGLLSCFSDDDKGSLYNARVVGPSLDCGEAYLIQLTGIHEYIPNENIDRIFVEINLPAEYKIANMLLQISYRMPGESEHLVCTALGPVYPELYITEVLASQ